MNDVAKIPCDQVLARLWEYLDGELPASDEAVVRTHLEACACCCPHGDFQRAYCTFLRRTAEQPVPPGLRRRVFETILAEEASAASRAVQAAEPLSTGARPSVIVGAGWWRRLFGRR